MKTRKHPQALGAPSPAAAMGRLPYAAPIVEIIEMSLEGSVMSASGNLGSYGDAGMFSTGRGPARNRSRGYNAASSSDLEDLINDILTIEK